MKLRLGQPVDAADGPFGELGDIIVDPHAHSVTHVVVQPERQHLQARLVPIGLVSEASGRLRLGLDRCQIRSLEPVADADHLRSGELIEVGPDWDVGTEDVAILPYHRLDIDLGLSEGLMTVSFDRIPKGDCEIRRTSDVRTSDEKAVGRVDGFLADDDQLSAIVVRVGMPGFRHDVLVPFASVSRVRTDQIDLSLTEEEFRALPRTDALGEVDGLTSRVGGAQRMAGTARAELSAQGHRLATLMRDRVGRGQAD